MNGLKRDCFFAFIFVSKITEALKKANSTQVQNNQKVMFPKTIIAAVGRVFGVIHICYCYIAHLTFSLTFLP